MNTENIVEQTANEEQAVKKKFTATIVNPEDKVRVQELRKQYNTTEKKLMAALIAVASNHPEELRTFFPAATTTETVA